MNQVRFYFDFISPYAWMALEQAQEFADANRVTWELRPISYGATLSQTGLVGPVEVPSKRNYTFDDVARCAQLAGLELEGPPAHPFRSLEALRLMTLLRDHPGSLEFARQLAAACWSRGMDLTDVQVLKELLQAFDPEVSPLIEGLSDPEAKRGLILGTKEALEAGVFGVPTFEFEGELFWGCDRLPHLSARLAGDLRPARDKSRRMLKRPSAIDRKR